jgi:phosphate transport system substrate-binding protein
MIRNFRLQCINKNEIQDQKLKINITGMTKSGILSVVLALFFIALTPYQSVGQNKLEGRISISGAFALYPMAIKWAEEFKKINPGVKIDISAGGAGKGITDVLNNMIDIGMVSREINPEEIKKGAIAFAVTKDAVVPVVSALNPCLKDILLMGLTSDASIKIWISGKFKTWSQAFDSQLKAPVHVYTRSDACGAAEVWAKFLGEKQEDLLGSAVFGDPGLALAVKKDALGIGFNNLGYVYDYKTRKQVPGIRVVPLDLNNNGKIDADEDFYDSMDKLIDAIAKGKYPSPPARDLFFVVNQKPGSKVIGEFLKWVLTDGQKYVNETGYINLSKEKIAGELKQIN